MVWKQLSVERIANTNRMYLYLSKLYRVVEDCYTMIHRNWPTVWAGD